MQFELKRSHRARTMRLAVYPDARVVVTAPQLFGRDAIERFVAKHLQWIERHVGKARGRSVIRISRGQIPVFKKSALALAQARSEHFCSMYGFTYKKISIRAQKTRWGSCSRSGNLSFNYKIALFPIHIVDYIIVHELCHLAEMNHSKKFWNLVANIIPRHKEVRKELRLIAIAYD